MSLKMSTSDLNGVRTSVVISGLQTSHSTDDIELYFDTPNSGGRKGSVKKCIIVQDGFALVSFDSPEVAANVVGRREHRLFGSPLQVQFAPMLIVTQLPSEIEMDYLTRLLEKVLGTIEFSIERAGDSSATLIFHKSYSNSEMETFVTKLENKKVNSSYLKAQFINEAPRTGSSTSIKVTGISADLTSDDLAVYFETPRSGGRKGCVRKCVIEHNGVAHVEFDDQEVAENVSKAEHSFFGCQLVVQYEPSKPTETSKLFLTQIPPEVNIDFLKSFLEKVLGTEEFSLERQDITSAIISFYQSIPDLQPIITKIESAKLRSRTLKAVTQDIVTTSVKITSVPTNITSADIQQYFEENNPECRKGCVRRCTVEPNGDAIVQFAGSEVAAAVVSKGRHVICGVPLAVQYAYLKQQVSDGKLQPSVGNSSAGTSTDLNINNESITKSGKCTPRLIVVESSADIHQYQLRSIVGKAANITGEEIVIERVGSKTAIILHKSLSNEEVGFVITSLHERFINGKKLTTTELKSSNAIVVSNINGHFYDEQFLLNYFENPKYSGGADVETVRLCGSGTALVFFQDHEMVSRVLQTSHNKYGLKVAKPSPTEAFQLWCSSLDICVTQGPASDAIVTEKIPVNQEAFAFVSQCKYSSISKSFPLLSVLFACPNIIVNGPSSVILQFQNQLPSLLTHYKLVPTELQSFFHFLKTVVGSKMLQDYIRSQKCSAVVYATDRHICLLCENDPSIIQSANNAAAMAVQSETLCRKLHPLIPDDKEFEQLCQKLVVDQRLHIKLDDDKVVLIGFKDDVQNGIEMLNTLMRKHGESSTSIVCVTLENGMWKMLQKNDWWKSETVSQKVSISVDPLNALVSVTIWGSNEIVQDLNHKIAAFKSTIINKSITISVPVHLIYSESNSIKDKVSGIESQFDVSIQMALVLDSNLTATSQPLNQEVKPNNDSFTNVFVTRTKEQKQIAIWIGDLTLFKADVMVNAANEDLKHIGGVAYAIAKKGGAIIQESSDAYIAQHKKALNEGEVFFTTAVGNLPCKALVHAVGPRWKDGRNNEDKLLFDACFKSLVSAAEYTSIALPAISGGIFGYPFRECARILLKGAIQFSSKHPTSLLQEINFILNSQSDAKVFVDALQECMSIGTSCIEPIQCTEPNTYSVSFSGDMQICKGNILDVQADVYVNSTSSDLDMASGQLSNALSKAAGPTFTQECKRKATTKRSPGDVIITEGGQLKCKHVFHVVLKHYVSFGNEADKVFKSAVYNCLKECAKRNLSSIAFPALGTGTHVFPIHLAAKLMINEAAQFLEDNRCSLKIYFVPYSDADFTVFQRELQLKMASTQSSTLSHSNVCDEGAEDGNVFCLEGYTIKVIHGDITNEQTDVIVNSTDKYMKPGGTGVAAAIFQKAGPQLWSYCDSYTSHGAVLQIGDVIKTPAFGNLKCKAIFHTFVQIDRLQSIVQKCLQKAVENKFVSISFPALGTGNHDFPSEKVVCTMIESIKNFCSTNTSSQLKFIHIVIFHADMYKSFIKMFQHSEAFRPNTVAVKELNPMFNEPEKAKDKVKTETYSFMIYGQSDKDVESAVAQLKSVAGVSSLSGISTTSEYSNTQKDLYQECQLLQDSEELRKVLTYFRQICSTGRYSVIKAYRIMNQSLQGKYDSKKRDLLLKSPSCAMETTLFCATNERNYPQINAHGFSVDFQQSSSSVSYQSGMEFLRDPARAVTSSPLDASGCKYVYVARVLAGTLGAKKYWTDASKTNYPPVGYDSVVDSISNPSSYVIFDSSQAYPEFLVKLKQRSYP